MKKLLLFFAATLMLSLHPSGVISPLFSSSILGTYWPGELISQCAIFSLFHAVHEVLKARILQQFAFPCSRGPRFVRTLHHDPSISGGPAWQDSQFHPVLEGCDSCDQFGSFSVTVVFILSALGGIRIRGLRELPSILPTKLPLPSLSSLWKWAIKQSPCYRGVRGRQEELP